ncbi:MAG: hypothetical protein FD127_3509 [Acidimicrobiaceae bacterium]|nr:MAG: hypothetical protein FD127_3509 [Acidimicrobiaceae bacterium]
MFRGREAVEGARLLANELSEAQASLRVYLTAAGLAVLGVSLLLYTIWWWRSSRPESPALGPLEVMGDRRWTKARDTDRRRLIDVHRPSGAMALDGMAGAPEPIDLSVLTLPSGFDDLRDPDPANLASLVSMTAIEPSGDEPLPHLPGDWHAHLGTGRADGDGKGRDGEGRDDGFDGLVIDPLLLRAATND